TLAGTGVGLCALSANRQALAVTDAPVTVDAHEAFEVHRYLAAQVALDDELVLRDAAGDLGELFVGQILGTDAGVHLRLLQNLDGTRWSDAVEIAKRDLDAFVVRNIDSE